MKIQADVQIDLAQLVRHWPEDPEVLVSIPTGTSHWEFPHRNAYREKLNCFNTFLFVNVCMK